MRMWLSPPPEASWTLAALQTQWPPEGQNQLVCVDVPAGALIHVLLWSSTAMNGSPPPRMGSTMVGMPTWKPALALAGWLPAAPTATAAAAEAAPTSRRPGLRRSTASVSILIASCQLLERRWRRG